jgi:dUTP pyrophosphatase
MGVVPRFKIKKLHQNAIVPRRAFSSDAGIDLFTYADVVISVGQRNLVKVGLAIEIPVGYEVQIRSRSGNAHKHGVVVLNSPGTIDQQYRGELGVILINHGDCDVEFKAGSAIAQMIVSKVELVDFELSDELDTTERDIAGFGSTG